MLIGNPQGRLTNLASSAGSDLAFDQGRWSSNVMSDSSQSGKLRDFEFAVYRKLQPIKDVANSKILIACSGGLDSVALLSVLTALKAKLNLRLEVAHVHHGATSDQRQLQARHQARDLVSSQSEAFGLKWHLIEPETPLHKQSEEAFREFRLTSLGKLKNDLKADAVALAHHADDLFETRLMRLIRGTGAQGLEAMSIFDLSKEVSSEARTADAYPKLRPFLGETRSAIRAYAEEKQLKWIDDPSNAETHFFRNWLRNEWLPALEAKRSGSVRSFARSLELLVHELQSPASFGTALDEGLDIALGKIGRGAFEGLELARKRSVIASLTRTLGARDFSLSRVEEVIKRLHHLESTGQKVARFHVGGIDWSISASEIAATVD